MILKESENDDTTATPEGSRVVTNEKKEAIPAAILDKPESCDVIRGFPISLCGVFKGSHPLKVTWRKGKDEVGFQLTSARSRLDKNIDSRFDTAVLARSKPRRERAH